MHLSLSALNHTLVRFIVLFLAAFAIGVHGIFLSPNGKDGEQHFLIVKNVTLLGPQRSTTVTNLSRDGGSSVLLNGNIVWLYDDTASRDKNGDIISFLSNTAAYSSEPNGSVTLVRDFGVVLANQSNPFQLETGILATEVVQNGGWIPFTEEEAAVNQKDASQKRVAICM